MSKIKGRECDICGEWLCDRDMQYWLKIPRRARLYYGYPSVDMVRCDVCEDCMNELMVEIHKRRKKGDSDA